MGASHKRSERSVDRRRRSRPSRLPLLVLVAGLVFFALSITFAHAQSLTITQCDGSSQSCDQSSTTTVTPSRPSGQRRSSSSGSGSSEVHTYSLRSGKGTVQTPDGSAHKDSIKLDVSPSVRQEQRHRRHHTPSVSLPVHAPPPRPPVSTNGGGGVAPSFAAPLSSVSADQALAQFAIPPFLMPVYQAASRAYGIPWNVLAAINQVETNFGRNLSVSSAGAVGWMQFMPATWRTWGVDASGDGYADPYNPVDAIYAAARYLRVSGGESDISRAIFSYNHADWYVSEVLKIAGTYGSLPTGVVGATSTLAYGRFPLLGQATYGDDFRADQEAGRRPRGLAIHGAGGATAIATQTVTVDRILLDPTLASDLKRRGQLASLGGPAAPNVDGKTALLRTASWAARVAAILSGRPALAAAVPVPRPEKAQPAADTTPAGGLPAGYYVSRTPGITVVVRDAAGDRYSYSGLSLLRGAVRPGLRLRGGQAIGTLAPGRAATLLFSVRAAGGAPVDPRPLVDGYRLQEAIDFYRAVTPFGPNPFVPDEPRAPESGQSLFASSSGLTLASEVSLAGVHPGVLRVARAIESHFPGLIITSSTGGNHVSGSYHYRGEALDIAGGTAEMNRASGWIMHSGLYRFLTEGIHNPNLSVSGGRAVPSSFYSGVWAAHANHIHIAVADSAPSQSPALPFLNPSKVDPAEEIRLSRRLAKLVNPKVARTPSSAAIKVPRPTPQSAAPTSVLELSPSAAGASVSAVSPSSGGTAWAVGTVDGAGRPGWARAQTVLLRYGGRGWQVVGPPRDARDRAANPTLRAIAATAHGGYAVGDRGAVVAFGRGAPRLLQPAAKATLAAVALARDGRSALAVGARGTVVRITGTRTRAERPAAGKPDLSSVAFAPDGSATIAAGPLRRSGAAGGGSSGYVNPFSQVTGLQPERIDMGVDYAGTGPVLAIGSGTVFNTAGAGWPGGSFIGIRLDSGPYAGLSYFLAENVKPTVRVGQHVAAGQQIAVMHGGIETGWAAGSGDQALAAALGQENKAGDPGAWSSAAGVSFNNLLVSTGAPSGVMQGSTVHGQMPAQYQRPAQGAYRASRYPLFRDAGNGPHAMATDFKLPHGTTVELQSVATSGKEAWVAGSITDPNTSSGPQPFAARRDGRGWRTFCSSGPAPAGVVELGKPTPSDCDSTLLATGGGPATAVAMSGKGALLATPAGPMLFDGKDFRPLGRQANSSPASPSISQLAVTPGGDGWAVSGDHQIGRIAPAGAHDETTPLHHVVRAPGSGATSSAAVAVPPGGGRALAITPQQAAVMTGASSRALPGPGLPVRAAASTGTDRAWAIADSGQLLAETGSRWSVPGTRSGLGAILGARRALGAAPLIAAGASGAPPGFAALAFNSPSDGYAVGSGGLIARYDGTSWKREPAPSEADLTGVAAGSGGVVAVGMHGTLLERDADGWHASDEAAALVGGQDFSGVTELADGTLLAVAGGSVIERPPAGTWQAAAIAPLGVSAVKLAGYRDGAGALHALVLARGLGGGLTLLDGDATHWRAVATPAGLALSDFAVDESTREVWLAGSDGQGAATAELTLPADGGGDPAAPQPRDLLGSLGL